MDFFLNFSHGRVIEPYKKPSHLKKVLFLFYPAYFSFQDKDNSR
jgi:hypothetical protein